MPRAQGFARGDLDTSFPLDDKFLQLHRSVPPDRYYAACGVYFHVAAATWREAERKSALKVCPDAAAATADLQAVGLLDSEGCVTRRAFSHSVGRAKANRRSAADRQQRKRAGMSRVTDRDERVTHAMSVGSEGPVVTGSDGPDGRVARANGAVPDDEDGYDRVVQWLATRKAWVDSPKMQTDLARLVDGEGVEPVLDAMAAEAAAGSKDAAQFIYGARNRLRPIRSHVERQTREERDRAEARRALGLT